MTITTPRGSMDAAEHFLILNDAEAEPVKLEMALLWLEQSDANRAAYEHVAKFMHTCDGIAGALSAEEVRDSLELSANDDESVSSNRWWQVAASIAALIGLSTLVLAMSAYLTGSNGGIAQQRYATAIGEVRDVELPDGSSVLLGGASAISVRFSPDQRDIVLTDGQAFFDVAKNPSRPFVVSAKGGLIRAVGTQFDVHQTPLGVNVTVMEGTVHVRSGRNFAALRANMQLSYAPGGQMGAVSWVEPRGGLDWRHGTLRFRSQPLSLVIADLNRYSSRPIVIGNAELASEEITGTVRVGRISEWLSGLAAASNLKVETDAQGSVVLTSARR